MTGRPTVMESFVIRETTNPYQTQLVQALSARVDVRMFSWPAALRGRYDAFHVHWPEVLIRDRTVLRTAARRMLFLLLLVRLRVGRKALVRTLHNVAPHEPGAAIEQLLLRLCDRWTAHWITLNESSVVPTASPKTVIVLGHFRDWFAGYSLPEPARGRLLCFGRIRGYKGVDRLIAAFREVEDSALQLRIVGNPDAAEVVSILDAAMRADPRITATLRHITDGQAATEFGQAELVVLPYWQMHNSGAVLLALSLGRPVLIPDNAINRALAREVGPDWVIRYDGEFDARSLTTAIAALRAKPPVGRPDLSGRGWDQIGQAHAEVFRRATQMR